MKLITGRFARTDAAAHAVEEIESNGVSQLKPILNQDSTPALITGQPVEYSPHAYTWEKLVAMAGALAFLLGILVMIRLGYLGKAAVDLPILFAFSGLTAAIVLLEAKMIFFPTAQRRDATQLSEPHMVEVLVETDEPETVERIMEDNGAEEVSIRAA